MIPSEPDARQKAKEEQTQPPCRFCGAPLRAVFADLGLQPLANSFITPVQLSSQREPRFPLRARVCETCFLVQTDETLAPERIFTDYIYFSSYSSDWVAHARRYAETMIQRFKLRPNALVAEVASNDGYLLQHFAARGFPVLGIEPAANVAEAARSRGVRTEVMFFNAETAPGLAERYGQASLMAANNVLAHVPDVKSFVEGFSVMLNDSGVATFEFPHLLRLIEGAQFDTIYHEHYSYLSLLTVERIFAAAGLKAFDLDILPTHGGSLRLYTCRSQARRPESSALADMREQERAAGLHRLSGYLGFQERAEAVKTSFLSFLDGAKAEGKSVAAYGAAAKGVTFLNFCGVAAAEVIMVADRNPTKQNRLLPGSHAPVVSPEALIAARPDYVVILPWNLASEIRTRMSAVEAAGGRFVIAMPETRVL
jgi:SAM-dependent methyltransferase